MLQKPRGTRDFLPDEMEARRSVEWRLRETGRRWGYREVSTPSFEDLELFTMRSGEGIIGEMYVFEDKGGRQLALRPEITAAVIRMYINEAKVSPKPLRWCYFADCFRYERPQKGRYRQFWQFGVELIGADTAMADAEVIMLAADMLDATGVRYELKVGHLALMKNLLFGLEPADQRKVRAFLDKRDYDGLKETLAAMGKPDLAVSLISLVECRTLKEAFAIAGEVPGRERIEQTLAALDTYGVKYSLNFGIARGLAISGRRTRSLAAGHTGSRTCLAGMMLPPAGLQSDSTGSWSRLATQNQGKIPLLPLSARMKGGPGRLKFPASSVQRVSVPKWT